MRATLSLICPCGGGGKERMERERERKVMLAEGEIENVWTPWDAPKPRLEGVDDALQRFGLLLFGVCIKCALCFNYNNNYFTLYNIKLKVSERKEKAEVKKKIATRERKARIETVNTHKKWEGERKKKIAKKCTKMTLDERGRERVRKKHIKEAQTEHNSITDSNRKQTN